MDPLSDPSQLHGKEADCHIALCYVLTTSVVPGSHSNYVPTQYTYCAVPRAFLGGM